MKPAPPTGLVDAETGQKVRAVASSGQQFAVAPPARVFWCRVLDTAAVGALAAGIGTPVLIFMGRSVATESAMALAAAAVWFAVVFAYGMFSGSVGALGDHAGGFRAVRLDDGSRPGVWRGGWRAVLWSFAPLYGLITLAGIFSGSPAGDWSESYSTRDLRAGIERGVPPIADPRVAEREARAAARNTARDAARAHRQG